MKIKFDVLVSKRMEIDVPTHWIPFAKAWRAYDENRTDEQWELVENHSWGDMIDEFLPEDECIYEVEIFSITEEESD